MWEPYTKIERVYIFIIASVLLSLVTTELFFFIIQSNI